MQKLLYIVLLFSFLSSCSGYRVKRDENPLARYNIHSLAIPVFQNKTNLPNVSAPFTKRIVGLLNSFSGLKIYSGLNKEADAVLLGIVRSPRHLNETLTVRSNRFTGDVTPQNMKGRRDFFIPERNYVNLELSLVLIKKPRKEELDIFSSDIAPYLKGMPRIILNEKMNLKGAYYLSNLDRAGSAVNDTQSAGNLEKEIDTLAIQASSNFKTMVLYAF